MTKWPWHGTATLKWTFVFYFCIWGHLIPKLNSPVEQNRTDTTAQKTDCVYEALDFRDFPFWMIHTVRFKNDSTDVCLNGFDHHIIIFQHTSKKHKEKLTPCYL